MAVEHQATTDEGVDKDIQKAAQAAASPGDQLGDTRGGEGLQAQGQPLLAQVVPDAQHGHVIRVSPGAASGSVREQLAAAVHERLDPLTVRHEID